MYAAVRDRLQPATKRRREPEQEVPPWELHARALGVPAYPSAKRLRPYEEKAPEESPLGPPAREQQEKETSLQTMLRERRLQNEQEAPRMLNPNPTAIRGWRSTDHLLEAIKLTGLPAPFVLQEHAAGFLRFSGPTVVVNYYSTTNTALVQGKMAGTWDERLRAARTLAVLP
jgi:hypothetical protein